MTGLSGSEWGSDTALEERLKISDKAFSYTRVEFLCKQCAQPLPY